MCKARRRMFRSGLCSRYGGIVGSAVHGHIIVAAPHLADGAGVHAPVWAGYKRDFESLCIHKVPQTGTAEGSDGLDHLRGQRITEVSLSEYQMTELFSFQGP